MVSLREVAIVGCFDVRFPEHVTELDGLRRLNKLLLIDEPSSNLA